MTHENLITVREGVSQDEARDLLRRHKIERLIVVDDDYRAVGLITVKDIEKSQAHPHAAKDDQGRLLVGAASTVGDAGYERSMALVDAGVDVVVIDTAHGHSPRSPPPSQRVKRETNRVQIVAGNVATYDAARALIDAGADAVKVGIGPGSICTTRIVAGVGVPQLTAIVDAVRAAQGLRRADHRRRRHQVLGRPGQGDRRGRLGGHDGLDVRRHRRGARRGVPLPGPVLQVLSRHGFGGGHGPGSADRYFQKDVADTLKLVPEGIEGQMPYKGPIAPILHQMVGGLAGRHGLCRARRTCELFQERAKFIRITGAGLRESHVHDVMITREAPNYPSAG